MWVEISVLLLFISSVFDLPDDDDTDYDDDDDVIDNETWMQMSLEPNIGMIRQELQFSQRKKKEIRLDEKKRREELGRE